MSVRIRTYRCNPGRQCPFRVRADRSPKASSADDRLWQEHIFLSFLCLFLGMGSSDRRQRRKSFYRKLMKFSETAAAAVCSLQAVDTLGKSALLQGHSDAHWTETQSLEFRHHHIHTGRLHKAEGCGGVWGGVGGGVVEGVAFGGCRQMRAKELEPQIRCCLFEPSRWFTS